MGTEGPLVLEKGEGARDEWGCVTAGWEGKNVSGGGGGKGRFGMGPREDCICEWGFQWE